MRARHEKNRTVHMIIESALADENILPVLKPFEDVK